MSLLSRLINALHPGRLTRDIDDELASHLEEAAEHGRTPAESRASLGSQLRLREASRDIRAVAWLDSLRADTVFAWRQLRKRRVTSLAAILSLGLAIGACTAAFRIVDALFLRPLPIAHPERLYALTFRGTDVTGKQNFSDSSNYPLFQQINTAVAGDAIPLAISFSGPWGVTYGSGQDLERANGEYVSGRMFSIFGLRPALGRLLTDDDDAPGHSYAVLSFDYWTRRFGRDANVVGRTFHYGRDILTIVGVAPEGFAGVEPGVLNDIFIPVTMNSNAANPGSNWFRIVLVVNPSVNIEQVRGRIQAVSQSFWQELVKTVHGLPGDVVKQIVNQKVALDPARTGASGMQTIYRQPLIALSVIIALVLLIACANVANLMTAQAASRAREMALRVSIGAGRGRLIQLVLIESAILGAFAAAVGSAFAIWAAPFVVARINPPDRPAQLLLPADGHLLGFEFALTLMVMLLYGLAPSLRASGVQPSSALKGGGDPRARARSMRLLIAAQVAFCFVVLFVAGLFVTTFRRLASQPLGFSPDRLLALDVQAPANGPSAVWDAVLDRLRVAPGVEMAARSDFALLSGTSSNSFVSRNGTSSSRDITDLLGIAPGWLETMKIPLLSGRDFIPAEVDSARSAIVNQAFVDRFFKGENALGKTFQVPLDAGAAAEYTIIGIAGNARYVNMREQMPPVAYFPPRRAFGRQATFMIRTASQNPLTAVASLRQLIANAAPTLRITNARTQQELIDRLSVRERLLALLAFFFAAVALLLAAIGLYGVLDYSVFQRRREIGIRLAIGARASHIVRGVTFAILLWVLAGSAAGLALGLAAARYIASLLYEVKPTDVSSLAAPALALLTAAILAALPPVLRAIRIDPVQALRSE